VQFAGKAFISTLHTVRLRGALAPLRSARGETLIKNHGAEVHRGIKDTEKTVNGRQAHSEKVLSGDGL